jgi:hypothetical protein
VRDVGIFVWVVLLVVGVIGSMVSSVRKNLPQSDKPQPMPPQWAPPGPQRTTRVVQVIQTGTPPQATGAPQATGVAPQVTGVPPQAAQQIQRLADMLRAAQVVVPSAPPPAPAPPPKPKPTPAAPQAVVEAPHASEPVRSPGRKLFGGRGQLVRAVIAAEVLGKPRALRDE